MLIYWHGHLSCALLKCAGWPFLDTGLLWSSGVGRVGGCGPTCRGFRASPCLGDSKPPAPRGYPPGCPSPSASSGPFWVLILLLSKAPFYKPNPPPPARAPTTTTLQEADSSELYTLPPPSTPTSRPSSPSSKKSERISFRTPLTHAPSSPGPFE